MSSASTPICRSHSLGEKGLIRGMPSLPRVWLWIVACPLVTPIAVSAVALSGSADLLRLADFKAAGANWKDAGGLKGNPREETALLIQEGTGVVVNQPGGGGGAKSDLFTEWEHADLELEGEFLLPKGSNSGIYFMGRYEIQLFDSWGKRTPGEHDLGALYPRWDAARGKGQESFDGVAPRANAARAPGLWQHLRIVFRAPRFDGQGKKIADARFERVELNGYPVLIDVAATGPTRSGRFNDEAAQGPLMIQGSHGPVALRNLRARVPKPLVAASKGTASRPPPAPILVSADERVRVQRGFVPFEPYKRLYACSVATPEGVNYAFDLETFSLLRVWRGEFLDTTEMWEGRGISQLAKPNGPALTLSGAPGVALLESAETNGWPVRPDPLYVPQGYRLEPDGTPVFRASLSGLRLESQIKPGKNGSSVTRTVRCQGSLPGWNCFLLLAEADEITASGPAGNRFMVGDHQWYLDFPEKSPHIPRILSRGGRQWLVVPLTKDTFEQPVSYSLVW